MGPLCCRRDSDLLWKWISLAAIDLGLEMGLEVGSKTGWTYDSGPVENRAGVGSMSWSFT